MVVERFTTNKILQKLMLTLLRMGLVLTCIENLYNFKNNKRGIYFFILHLSENGKVREY